MTKLDAVIEKLRALPEDEQLRIAVEIEFLLAEPDWDARVLTPEQDEELQRRLDDPNSQRLTHEEVIAHFQGKYGA